jgi:hypothetical protein
MVKTHCFLGLPHMGEKDDKIYTKFPPTTNLQERKQIHSLLILFPCYLLLNLLAMLPKCSLNYSTEYSTEYSTDSYESVWITKTSIH